MCLPCVSAEERGSSGSLAVWVPHLQPAHTDFIRAQHEMGFLAVKVGLYEPPAVLPVTSRNSAFCQLPGSRLGQCPASSVLFKLASASQHWHLGSPQWEVPPCWT